MLVGEGILKFLLDEIHKVQSRKNSFLVGNFIDSLEKRFDERRDAVFSSLILYLSNPDALKSNHPLKLTSKTAAVKFGLEMMKRLFKDEEQTTRSDNTEATAVALSYQERLELAVGSVQAGTSQPQENASSFKKEFDFYDRHRVRGPLLDKLFDALCSAQPTSTQSERNFSLAAGIATKKRTRMSSEKLNACCFLKAYFMNKK